MHHNMKNTYIFLLSIIFILHGCESKISMTESWACPDGAVFKSWKDGYSGEEKKFTAYGCRDSDERRVGFHIAWREQGIKEHEGSFTEGKPSGEWSYFHEDGTLKSRGYFVGGEKDGFWSYWDTSGNFKNQKEYSNGTRIHK